MLTHKLAKQLLAMPNREVDIDLVVHGGTFGDNEEEITEAELAHRFDCPCSSCCVNRHNAIKDQKAIDDADAITQEIVLPSEEFCDGTRLHQFNGGIYCKVCLHKNKNYKPGGQYQ